MFPAAFLAGVEETLPHPLHRYFDLIVGTSTGGIIALGLALGFKASEILNFYEHHGPKIFCGNGALLTLKQALWRKYSQRYLNTALRKTFGDRLIGQAKTRLVVTSMNIDTGGVHLFKTAHHERFTRDYKVSVVEAALATSAAPTFFPQHKSTEGIPLIDGGLWANNPIGVAVAEAIGVLEWSKAEIKVLSLGCTQDLFDVGLRRKRSIGLAWATAPKIAEVFMQGQSNGALGMAYTMLGHDNIFRVNQTVTKGRFQLDAAKKSSELTALGKNSARHETPKLGPVFFQETAPAFAPCHQI